MINIDSWVKFYNFWPKNDVEKWSRRNVYEIATCGIGLAISDDPR